jgi:hypothetical protein
MALKAIIYQFADNNNQKIYEEIERRVQGAIDFL